MPINLTEFQLMIALNSPAKIALRRAVAFASKGLALDAFVCRFYVDVIEPYVSLYCSVLVLLAGCSYVSQ